MKTLSIATLALVTLELSGPSSLAQLDIADYAVVGRGPDHRVLQRLTLVTNEQGVVTLKTNTVVQLSSGMHRWTGSDWAITAPQLVVTNGGIIGRGARHSAFFAENANTFAACQIRAPGSNGPVVIKSHALCLLYHDHSVPTNIVIATLNDSAAQIVGTNEVLYPAAFTGPSGLTADLRYFYDRAGIRQEIVLRTQLPSPTDLNLNPRTVALVAVSEIAEAPSPTVQERSWSSGGQTVRDQTLSFSPWMRMVVGRAFSLADDDRGRAIRVTKTYEITPDGRRIILERVPFRRIQPFTSTLPFSAINYTNAASSTATNAGSVKPAKWFASFPAAPSAASKPRLAEFSKRNRARVDSIAARVEASRADAQRGFVLDWNYVYNGDYAWFDSGYGTYVVDGEVHLVGAYFAGYDTIVIKYTPGSSVYLDGPLYYLTSSPTILTSICDNDWGEQIWPSGYCQYGPALVLDSANLQTARANMTALYATPAIVPNTPTPAVSITASDSLATKGASPADSGTFTITRVDGDWGDPLEVHFAISGTAANGTDYTSIADSVTISPYEESSIVTITPGAPRGDVRTSTAILTLTPDSDGAYLLSSPSVATVTITDPTAPPPPPIAAPAGLIGWWRGEQDALDSAGSNPASAVGGLGFAPAKVGYGFNFDGIDDRLNVNSPVGLDFGERAPFSIEAWIKPIAAYTDHDVQVIIDKRYTPNDYSALGYSFYLVNGVLGFQLADAPFGSGLSGYGPAGPYLCDNQFHHVAVTVDRTTTNAGHLYVDGTSVLTFNAASEPGDLSTNQPFRIGNHAASWHNCFFKGIIDEVSIYNRALSSNEVKSIFNSGPSGKIIPPSIRTQPLSQTVSQGSAATFSVVATGGTPLTYQWFFNGIPIVGATSSSYTRSNLHWADQGSYAVVVSNAGGSAMSSDAVLTIHCPPAITLQPANQIAPTNDTAIFYVEATGTAPLNYQWKFNNAPIPGATESTLSLPGVQPAMAGAYSVDVSNPYGSASSSSANLSLLPQSFVLGINLNGSDLTIGGHPWLSYSQALSQGFSVSNASTDWRALTSLVPTTDLNTSNMLQSLLYRDRLPSLSEQQTAPPEFYRRWGVDGWDCSCPKVFVIPTNVAPGYVVQTNLYYAGWELIPANVSGYSSGEAFQHYPCKLYYSYAPLPPGFNRTNLNRINYILNHRQPGSDFGEVQDAIAILNYGIPDTNWHKPAAECSALLNDAWQNGTDFVPAAGQIELVIIVPTDPNMVPFGIQVTNAGVSFSMTRSNLANGDYSAYLWLAEDQADHVRKLDLKVQGTNAATGIGSMALGQWTRVGPCSGSVTDGTFSIEVGSQNPRRPHRHGSCLVRKCVAGRAAIRSNHSPGWRVRVSLRFSHRSNSNSHGRQRRHFHGEFL